MILHCVIPSRQRPAKLKDCITSLNKAIEKIPEHTVYTFIYLDTIEEVVAADLVYKDMKSVLIHKLQQEYQASTFWNTHLQQYRPDVFIYLNDDTIIDENMLERIVKIFDEKGLDLAIGIKQANLPSDHCCKMAFGALGSTFINRFRDRVVFNPSFFRFYLDKELELYSTKHNLLWYSDDIKIAPLLIHRHPMYNLREKDNTHFHVRTFLERDEKMFLARQEKNLLWGDSYEVI